MDRPNPADLAERYRSNGEEFTLYLLDHYTKTEPDVMERMGLAIEVHLRASFASACTLDERAEACGEVGMFLRTFMNSVFCDPGFFRALFDVARVPFDKTALRPVAEAMERGEDTTAAYLLFYFRERLKDGFTPESTLRYYGEAIGAEIADGNIWLLERLADSSRQTYKHTSQRWMLRAWMPLALWQDVTAEEKERRLRAAWRVTKAAGLSIPDLPLPHGGKPYPIATLIASTKAAIKAQGRS